MFEILHLFFNYYLLISTIKAGESCAEPRGTTSHRRIIYLLVSSFFLFSPTAYLEGAKNSFIFLQASLQNLFLDTICIVKNPNK